jgi:hypothetical protein
MFVVVLGLGKDLHQLSPLLPDEATHSLSINHGRHDESST